MEEARRSWIRPVALLLLLGCGPRAPDDPQLPPTSVASLEAWLSGGSYRQWSCEPASHPARPSSAHGTNRVCSNALLSQHDGGGGAEYPVGAASVKEQFASTGELNGFSVAVKTAKGAGESWWWWERAGSSTFGGSNGASVCTGCHSGAPRDFVFTQVR